MDTLLCVFVATVLTSFSSVSAFKKDDAILFSNKSTVDRCIVLIGGGGSLLGRKYVKDWRPPYEYYHPDENTTCDGVDRLPVFWGEEISPQGRTACYLSATNQIVTADTTSIKYNGPPSIGGVYSLTNQSVSYLPLSEEVFALSEHNGSVRNGSTFPKFTSSVGSDQCVTCRVLNTWTPVNKTSRKSTNNRYELICRRYDANNPQAGWQRILPLPAKIVAIGKAAVALGDTLYVIGEDERAPRLAGVYNTLHRYEVDANRWHKEPSPRVVRSGMFVMTALSPTELLLCGGAGSAGRRCEIYDVPQRRWRITGSMNVDRIGGQLVPFNGDVYAVGGWQFRPTRFSMGDALSSVERYNRTSEMWTLVKPLRDSRYGYFPLIV